MSAPSLSTPHGWRAGTVDAPPNWYYRLSQQCLAELDQAVTELKRQPRSATTIGPGEFACPACSELAQTVLDALENGRGFAVIDGLPRQKYSAEEATAIYWIVGQLLGAPFEQNVQGTLLYDVRDTGQQLSEGARFSVTNYESSFHTDNSFGDDVLDYVGLLCLQTAKSGGLSQVISGYAVLDELQQKHPDVLEILRRPFHVDRRGGVKPGESPTARIPVIEENDRGLLLRYLRYWIEAGHDKVNQPLSADEKRSLDVLDAVLRQRDLVAEFMLEPGQMFYINNRTVFHNRTAFEDFPELERRRHYVRLWLKSRVA